MTELTPIIKCHHQLQVTEHPTILHHQATEDIIHRLHKDNRGLPILQVLQVTAQAATIPLLMWHHRHMVLLQCLVKSHPTDLNQAQTTSRSSNSSIGTLNLRETTTAVGTEAAIIRISEVATTTTGVAINIRTQGIGLRNLRGRILSTNLVVVSRIIIINNKLTILETGSRNYRQIPPTNPSRTEWVVATKEK